MRVAFSSRRLFTLRGLSGILEEESFPADRQKNAHFFIAYFAYQTKLLILNASATHPGIGRGRRNAISGTKMNAAVPSVRKSHLITGSLLLQAACIFCGISPAALAQGPLPNAPQPLVETSSFVSVSPSEPRTQHRFWDKQNVAWFAATAALNVADFAVTRLNLQSGGTELNPIVRLFGRSTAGLAVNFAGDTAGVIVLSYFFHRTEHHRLERMASTINIGLSAGAVTYGLTHR